MSDLNHLWQRFLLTASLVVGLAIGVGATVFGYSNVTTVNVHWSVFHIDGVPLWTVTVVPLVLVLIAFTIYHWLDGLHHFTEHMRHRRRVHELEAEVATLRAHLDQVLDMPDHASLPDKKRTAPLLPAVEDITDLRPTTTADGLATSKQTAANAAVAKEPVPAPAVAKPDAMAIGPRNETNARKGRRAAHGRVALTVAGVPAKEA